jgi:hypothetical protein
MFKGTAQFMAIEILRAVLNKSPIPRETHHDLESLLWVIIYTIYRRTIESIKVDSAAAVQREFVAYFGGSTVQKILDVRRRAQEGQPELRKCVDSPRLLNLLTECSMLLLHQNPARSVESRDMAVGARRFGRSEPKFWPIMYHDVRLMLNPDP